MQIENKINLMQVNEYLRELKIKFDDIELKKKNKTYTKKKI